MTTLAAPSEQLDVAALWDTEAPGLRRFIAYKLGAERDLADDFVSDVFARAWERRHQYRDVAGGSPKKWLYTLAINRVNDHWRRRRLTVPLERGGASFYTLRFEESETRREIAAALDTLTDRQRAVVVARFYEGYGLGELGHIATLEGAKKLSSRALTTLRRRLERVA